MPKELKNNHKSDWWNNLDYMWKKQIYLNYRLSKEDINWRISAFLDDSYGLEFIMCKIFNIESNSPNDDLIKLDNYVKREIAKIEKTTIIDIQSIEEIILQDVDNLKPIECLTNLKLIYLDHCKTHDLNNLNNINELCFYETPEYPTNTPSLYRNSEKFNDNIKILKNSFDEVQQYFIKKTNAL